MPSPPAPRSIAWDQGPSASHVTAAMLHGLPVWRIPLRRVHVTRRSGRSGSRANNRVHVHAAPLTSDEICQLAGMTVTTVDRTVTDLARTVPFEEAVVVADAALHSESERPRTDGGRWIRRHCRPPWSGRHAGPAHRAARRAIAFADGRSASVGESRSRVALCRAGLPAPVTQWPVLDEAGAAHRVPPTSAGRELRTVGEFDGRVKYGRLLRPGQDPGDVVFAEKVREDRLRDQGLAVVRWTWTDLDDFGPTTERLRRQFRR